MKGSSSIVSGHSASDNKALELQREDVNKTSIFFNLTDLNPWLKVKIFFAILLFAYNLILSICFYVRLFANTDYTYNALRKKTKQYIAIDGRAKTIVLKV